MTKHKYFPAITCLALMILHFFAAYPGGMSVDSFGQFSQTFSHTFDSHHPPIMSMIWSVFNFIYQGPQLMLLFHLSLLWAGVILLFYADDSNKFRWLYIVIPFLPNILSQSGHIWKDIGFGFSFFFVTSACIFYIYKNKKAPIWVVLGLLLLCFYGCAVKFQAQFILPIIVFFVVYISTERKLLVKLTATAIISTAIIFTNSTIMNHYATNTQSWQLRQLFDIAAIVKDINDDSELPQYLKDYEGYSFEGLKENFSHNAMDYILSNSTGKKVFATTLDQEKLEQLNNTFIKLVTHHPISYLKHRFYNFLIEMGRWTKPDEFISIKEIDFTEVNDAYDINIHKFENNHLTSFVIKYLAISYKLIRPITTNAMSFLLILLYAFHLKRNFDLKNNDVKILTSVTFMCMVFSIVIFITLLGSDYRYYYVVRLLSLFSIPIFLKMKYQVASDSE